MDSTSTTHIAEQGTVSKLKNHKFQLGVSFVVIALIAGVSGLTMSRKHEPAHAKAHGNTHENIGPAGLWQTFAHAVVSVQEKMDALKKADEENEKLRKENAHLRLVLESEHYEKYAEKAQKETQTFQWKLSKDTGSRTGRTLASIGYKIPQDLLPAQLYSLGLSYFKMREDEKAAVIFTFLTGLEGDDSFKTPANHLLTGIAWYRIENFELADFYFDQVLHSAETKSTRRFHGQAKLWKGMISEKTGKHSKAQYWLRDVLDHDPHSVEAHWVNRSSNQEEAREPASEAHEESHEDTHGDSPDGPHEKPHEAAHEDHHH
jgi:tetratricopeptide (TPR) repeat protein